MLLRNAKLFTCMPAFAAGIGTVLALFSASASWAAVIRVPADLPTIQQGLDSASTNDTVLVAPGTYYEHITWPYTKGIDLIGEFGAELTTIDGDSSGRVITMIPYLTPNTVIKGFRIQGGHSDSGGGIYCSRTSPTILDVAFSHNWALFGGAVLCTDAASPIIRNSTFQYNSAGQDLAHSAGGAVYCELSSDAVIENNRITGNRSGFYGGAIHALECSPIIRGNFVAGNTAYMGGGIVCQFCTVLINGNMITGNKTQMFGTAGGILLEYSQGIILSNEIADNNSSMGGGGIALIGSSPLIQDNMIESNEAYNPSLSTGGGISCEAGSSPVINGNIIRGNVAWNGYGGGIHCSQSSPTITHNLITRNDASFVGGGIFTNSGITANYNNIFWNERYDLFCSQPGTLDASLNWWGDESGPFDPSTGPPDYNPDGLGGLVTNYVSYRPWLADSVTTGAMGLSFDVDQSLLQKNMGKE